jgi:hypothetical protein
MKRLNPTAPPWDAIEAGLVVDDLHGSLYQNLAARAELEPGSQQLLAGGVGSGKTTELLLAVKWLHTHGNIPVYVDVAAFADLSQPSSGAVLAAFGVRLAEVSRMVFEDISSSEHLTILERTEHAVQQFAYGTWIPTPSAPLKIPAPSKGCRVGGKLPRAIPVLDRGFPEVREPLQALLKALRDVSLDVVALFDGLDRLLDPGTFWATVEADFAALRELEVSVLAVAPITVSFEVGRTIPDQFDRVHHLVPLIAEPEAGGKLRSVLERRGATDLLQSPAADLTCSASGGVLRDLVSLARDAGEEAYVSGAERIGQKHAEKAVRQLGTGYLRGLGPEEIRALSQLDRTGSFDLHSVVNVGLLATRRVLEYSHTGFRVHPALLPLIREGEAHIA